MTLFRDAYRTVHATLAPLLGSTAATIVPDRTLTGTARVIIRSERPADNPQASFVGHSEPRYVASLLREDLAAELESGDRISIPDGRAAGVWEVDRRQLPRDNPASIVVPVIRRG